MADAIVGYEYELAEAGCAPGSGRYGVRVMLPADISRVFPYLNAVLDDTWYDRENHILLGSEHGRRIAFRPDDIRIDGIADIDDAYEVTRAVVDRVNQVWQERDRIQPCFRERKLPAVADIYRFLPKTNCKRCGYQTCLVYAAELRDNRELVSECPPLSEPGHADSLVQIEKLFTAD